MKRKKWIVGLVALIIIMAVGGFFMAGKKKTQVDVVPEIEQTLVEQTLQLSLFADGIVEAENEQNIFSAVSGTIKSVHVKVGDSVQKGDTIMTLDTSKLMQSLEQAKYQLMVDQDALKQLKVSGTVVMDTNLSKANAAYDRAKQNYSNGEVLFQQGAISASELDQLESVMENAYSEWISAYDKRTSTSIENEMDQLLTKIKVNQLAIESITAESDTFEVKAPMAGLVTATLDTVGKTVGIGENLATVSDLSLLKVSSHISEYDIQQVQIGQSVLITTLGNETAPYTGSVLSIAPTGELVDGEVLVEVIVGIDNPDATLKPNFTTNLEIIIEERVGALAVPFDALIEDGDQQFFVTKKTDSGYEKVAVQKGLETDVSVQIISTALKAGDVLVWVDKVALSAEDTRVRPSLLPEGAPSPPGM